MLNSRPPLRRFAICFLSIISGVLLPTRAASAQPMELPSTQPAPVLPAGYTAQILTPEWRAAFPHRAAFGSLCSLAPLACALIDRPFAFNAHLELVIRPNAPDGSTSVLLPFAISVPLLGRAEVGLGSCFAGFWASKDVADKANADSSLQRPSGLCPFWLAGKLLIFPWFRDPHKHPALAAEYLFEYQAGPFSGVNQLGLPGPLSKVSLAYRHPLGRLELAGAVSVLVDHVSRAGTLQFGTHVGYRLPVGEHFWLFGQAMAQAPSWGPLVPDMTGQLVNLAPPVAGVFAVGAQQRADFGFGTGLTLMLTKSEIETRVDFLFRVFSFELGPHIKPLIPAHEKKDEPQSIAVPVKPQVGPQLECPPGYQVQLPPQTPTPSALPNGTPAPAPAEPKCVPIPPRYRIPSPRWGQPCYLAPLDGSAFLRMGTVDSTGQSCEWDGLRLPLGAVIDPPEPVPHAERGGQSPSAPTPQNSPAGAATMQARSAVSGALPARGHSGSRTPTAVVAAVSPPPQTSGRPAPPSAPRQDRVEHVTEEPRSIPGSAFASGFIDGTRESYNHARDLYRLLKKHGPGVVVPSREAVEGWLQEVKEQCLDHLDDCARDKAKEAAQALNDFQQKPWEDKKYTAGRWAWGAMEMAAETAASGLLPGAGTAVRVGEGAAERTLAKGTARAAVKKAGKEAGEEGVVHGSEAAVQKAAEAEARRAAAQAEAKREAKARLEQEAKARAEQEAKERAAKEAEKRAAENATKRNADFVVTEDGTAVPVSQSRMREGFERAEFPERPRSPDKPEPGQIHTVPTKYGPVDVRTMEGSAHHDRRAVFTRSGTNQPVKIGGEPIKGNVPKQVQRDLSHLPQKE